MVERSRDDRLHALARAPSAACASTATTQLWQWSVDELEDFWALDLGLLRGRSDVPATPRPRLARDARRARGSRAPSSTTPSTSSATATPPTRAILHASELRELGELTWGELRSAGRRGGRRPARLGVGRGDRVVAYLPNIPEAIVAFLATASIGAIWSSLLARLRRRQRRRPLRPDRAQGPASPSTATATAARTSTAATVARRPAGGDAEPASTPSSSPTSTADPDLSALRDAITWAELLAAGHGRRADLRAGPLRPPALGPLLLRHDRPAEGDRPGPGRDPARAPEEAPPPRRRPARRPHLLVHDDRLDDVELPRLRPAHPSRDRPLRRQPRPPRHGRPLGPRRARRDHLLRHQRLLHRRLHEGRASSPAPAATSRACARSARPARRSPPRASTGSTSTSAPTPGSSRPAAAPTSAPPSSAASPPCPSTAASSRPARSAPRSRPGTRTAGR